MASSSLAVDTATLTWWVLVCLFLCSLRDFFSCKTPPGIGELIGIPNTGRLIHSLVHNFPKLQYMKLGISFGIFLAHTTFIAGCKHRCNPSPIPSSVSIFLSYLTSDGTKDSRRSRSIHHPRQGCWWRSHSLPWFVHPPSTLCRGWAQCHTHGPHVWTRSS